jgi:hypothetical protein
MRVLVCGGRNFDDRQTLCRTLDEVHWLRKFELLIAGGARGADTLAEEWARDRDIPTIIYHADLEGLGRKAGPIRNQRMLDEGRPELVIAFPGGRGTADMTSRARAAAIETILVQWNSQ